MQSVHKTTEEILAGVRDPELRQAAAGLKRAMDNNPRDVPDDVSEPQTAKILQLPPWQEAKRGVPNSMLRGALFAAIQGQHRQYMQGEFLAAQQGIEIRFTGMQLDQSDLDVWEFALHLAREHPLGTRCYFTAYDFLKTLDRKAGKSDYEWLHSAFIRLTACAVEIKHNDLTYFGSLLIGGARDNSDPQNRYILEINPKIMALYDAGWTNIDWQQRQLLKRKPLALWLHGFYSSHAAPYPMRVETLMKLSGGRTKKVKHYTANLKKSMELLEEVGTINGFEIQNGLVTVDNVPSDSQKRHLNRASRRRK